MNLFLGHRWRRTFPAFLVFDCMGIEKDSQLPAHPPRGVEARHQPESHPFGLDARRGIAPVVPAFVPRQLSVKTIDCLME